MEKTKHWAESLQSGDRVKATIRNATDGTLNRHNVELIVIETFPTASKIIAADGKKQVTVPYNELQQC